MGMMVASSIFAVTSVSMAFARVSFFWVYPCRSLTA
jgi:hypothetical protein